MLCFVHTLQRHKLDSVTNFRDTVQQLPEVLECHHVTGEYDYLLKIIVRNRKHLESFLMNKLTPIRQSTSCAPVSHCARDQIDNRHSAVGVIGRNQP